jgi:hypothetical protein
MSDDEYPIVVDDEMSAKPRIGVAVDITDSKVELKFILATTYRKRRKNIIFTKKKLNFIDDVPTSIMSNWQINNFE